MRYIFFTALWEGALGHSQAYFDHILDLQLRVIGEELKDEKIEYHIVGTKQSDVGNYRKILESKRGGKSSFIQPIFSVVPVADGTPPQIKLNYLSQQFIKERENSGDVLIYNVPDYIYSTNTFKWIKHNLKAGKKICSIYTPKVIRELVLEKNLWLLPRALWLIVKDCLHEGHLKQFVDSEIGFIKYPSGIYHKTDGGHVCFPITMHPFAFVLDRKFSNETYNDRMSIEQGLQACYTDTEFALQSSINEFLILELTKMDLPWADDTDYSGYNHELITNWFRFGEMAELQRRFLRHSVAFDLQETSNRIVAETFHQELIEYVDQHYYHRN